METNNKLKERRIELGLTLEEVAKHVGVSKTTVSRWETGEISNMRRDKIGKLAEILKVRPSFIMGIEDRPQMKHRGDFMLPNGKVIDIKYLKNINKFEFYIGDPGNPNSFKKLNLDDEYNQKLKDSISLLEFSLKYIEVKPKTLIDLEAIIADIFVTNYVSSEENV
jgi:ORF020